MVHEESRGNPLHALEIGRSCSSAGRPVSASRSGCRRSWPPCSGSACSTSRTCSRPCSWRSPWSRRRRRPCSRSWSGRRARRGRAHPPRLGGSRREGAARGTPLLAAAARAGASPARRRELHVRLAGLAAGDEARARHPSRSPHRRSTRSWPRRWPRRPGWPRHPRRRPRRPPSWPSWRWSGRRGARADAARAAWWRWPSGSRGRGRGGSPLGPDRAGDRDHAVRGRHGVRPACSSSTGSSGAWTPRALDRAGDGRVRRRPRDPGDRTADQGHERARDPGVRRTGCPGARRGGRPARARAKESGATGSWAHTGAAAGVPGPAPAREVGPVAGRARAGRARGPPRRSRPREAQGRIRSLVQSQLDHRRPAAAALRAPHRGARALVVAPRRRLQPDKESRDRGPDPGPDRRARRRRRHGEHWARLSEEWAVGFGHGWIELDAVAVRGVARPARRRPRGGGGPPATRLGPGGRGRPREPGHLPGLSPTSLVEALVLSRPVTTRRGPPWTGWTSGRSRRPIRGDWPAWTGCRALIGLASDAMTPVESADLALRAADRFAELGAAARRGTDLAWPSAGSCAGAGSGGWPARRWTVSRARVFGTVGGEGWVAAADQELAKVGRAGRPAAPGSSRRPSGEPPSWPRGPVQQGDRAPYRRRDRHRRGAPSRSYLKLGVRSRSQLAGVLAGGAADRAEGPATNHGGFSAIEGVGPGFLAFLSTPKPPGSGHDAKEKVPCSATVLSPAAPASSAPSSSASWPWSSCSPGARRTPPPPAKNRVQQPCDQERQTVQTVDLKDGAVTTEKLALDSVTSDQVQERQLNGTDVHRQTRSPAPTSTSPRSATVPNAAQLGGVPATGYLRGSVYKREAANRRGQPPWADGTSVKARPATPATSCSPGGPASLNANHRPDRDLPDPGRDQQLVRAGRQRTGSARQLDRRGPLPRTPRADRAAPTTNRTECAEGLLGDRDPTARVGGPWSRARRADPSAPAGRAGASSRPAAAPSAAAHRRRSAGGQAVRLAQRQGPELRAALGAEPRCSIPVRLRAHCGRPAVSEDRRAHAPSCPRR
jgi:hypothetical protein